MKLNENHWLVRFARKGLGGDVGNGCDLVLGTISSIGIHACLFLVYGLGLTFFWALLWLAAQDLPPFLRDIFPYQGLLGFLLQPLPLVGFIVAFVLALVPLKNLCLKIEIEKTAKNS